MIIIELFVIYTFLQCFRVKLCDLSLQIDEMLLWKVIQFVQMSGAESVRPDVLLQPPNCELPWSDPLKTRWCHFGMLELEIGFVALSGNNISYFQHINRIYSSYRIE